MNDAYGGWGIDDSYRRERLSLLGKARIPKGFAGIKKMEKFMCARTQKLKFAAWMTTASHGDQASSLFYFLRCGKSKKVSGVMPGRFCIKTSWIQIVKLT